VALSPDGSTIVLLGEDGSTGRLYRRNLEHLEWAALPGTEGAWQPFFSADGTEVGFFSHRRLMRMPLDGLSPTTIAEVGANPRGAAWAPDGTIVFGPSQTSGLLKVSARGGTPVPLTELDPEADERSHRWPQVLPDGRTILFTVDYADSTFDEAGIETVSLDTGQRRALMRGGAHARYVSGGHIVYARGGRLFAVPFDLARRRRGRPP
jgi:serine/threonine-protein kinase